MASWVRSGFGQRKVAIAGYAGLVSGGSIRFDLPALRTGTSHDLIAVRLHAGHRMGRSVGDRPAAMPANGEGALR